MNIREDYIYARQSVDRKDSISIESQIDFCKYELKGAAARFSRTRAIRGRTPTGPSSRDCLTRSAKGRCGG